MMRLLLALWLALGAWQLQANETDGQRYCVAVEHAAQPVCAYEFNPSAARSVVLIHGLHGSARADWAAQITLLSRYFHVVAIELPGFDDPSALPADYSITHFADVVSRLVQERVAGPYSLIGHSLGGAIALRIALDSPPRVERLILVSVPGILHRLSYSREVAGSRVHRGSGTHSGLAALVEKLSVKLLAMIETISGRSQPSERLLRRMANNPVAMAALQLVTHDFGAELAQLDLPVLLLWGEDDQTAPLRIAHTLQARLPNARLQVFPDVGHVPMQQAAEAFNRTVQLFLLRQEWPERAHAWGIEQLSADEGERIGHCFRQRGQVFEGNYRHIEIRSCEGVVIRNARVDSLELQGARVAILHSQLGQPGAGTALRSQGSDVKITASRLQGALAIETAGSRIDLAAVHIEAGAQPVRAESGSTLIFSLSEIHRNGWMRLEHRYLQLERGEFLPAP